MVYALGLESSFEWNWQGWFLKILDGFPKVSISFSIFRLSNNETHLLFIKRKLDMF